MNAYLEYDADVFRDKTVLLPCDDPEWSNFTKFFAQDFERLRLRKLISTSYAPTGAIITRPTALESGSPQFDPGKTTLTGRSSRSTETLQATTGSTSMTSSGNTWRATETP